MKIAFNPSTVAALTSPPDNKDITFDLRGHNIFARGVKFQGTDTNTWRDIKINNVSIGSHTLDLRNGSNTTLTNTNGVVIINSTWRPVVDSLTSNSATSSLSANQGRVLAGLINGKSDSDHNHDDRYVKRSGDTMLGALNFANGTWNLVGDDVYMGDHNIGGQLCIMGANGTTGLSFHKYGDASIRKSITFDGNTLYMNGSCDYATLSNQTNLLAINTVPNKTAATSIGSWSPISGRYVFHQKWTDTSTGGDTADFGIYLDGNLTANMVLDGYYNSLLGFRVIGATGGFLKANGTIDNSTYLTSHQSLSNYYTKGEIDNQLGKYKLKSSIWVPETKVICSNFRDFLNKENLHKQALEELNLYRFFAQNDESNYSSKYNYPVVDSHAMVFSIDGNNSYIRSMNFDLRSNDIYVTSRVAGGEWRNWVKLLDSSNYSGILDSRYYTESEINSLLDAKLNRQNLSYGTWNPRGYHLAADYHYNGGDLSISENGGKMYVSIDGQFYQNEGQYRVLDTSDIGSIRGGLTLYQYLSSTDTNWFPLVWGGSDHKNTNNSTGSLYKSYDKLSWQTSTQTLYATNIQTENIKRLSIGGGIYWNPNVESASDSSDAASITLVKSGVAGGTTLVLSQMNDANDTIQFKTNAAAKLYHNSYPILTTQNTYVNNHKGYIYGTEITQVNNSDTVDGWHKDNIQWTGYITSPNSIASYWFKMYDITVTGYQYNDITITFLVSEGYSRHFSIFYLRIRQNGTNNSGNYNLEVTLKELVGNLRDEVVVYYNNSTGNVQLWGDTRGQWNTMNYTILKKTIRTATDSSSLGTLTAQSFNSVQTPPSTGYSKVTMARVGSVSYSDSTGSVHWNNVTNKPSSFTPSSHTHTWTSITDKIVAGNEFNIVNAGFKDNLWLNFLPINDRSKSATIDFYHLGNGHKGYASLIASGFLKNGGTSQQLLRADGGVATFNWIGQSGQPTWLWGGNSQHSYYVYNPSNFRVAYAASAGNAETLGGMPKNYGQAPFGTIPCIGNDGVMEIGRYIDYHYDNSGKYDFSTRLQTTGNYGNVVSLPSASGTLALISQVVTADTGLLRYSRNNVNISSSNCSSIPPSLLEWTIGYPRLYDPEFNDGYNNVGVYNNAGNGVVTVTRVHDTNVGNSSSYVMKVVSAAGAIPNYGGWHVATQTELGKVYTCLFRASIPSGVKIEWNSNSIGTGGQMSWLTNNMGTGKWTWYAVQVYCGSGGSSTFFFSAKSPCTWYLSYVNVIENNRASYAGLRSVYSDYLKANASIVFGRNELQYFNQYTGVTAGATSNANPKTDWYHILRMNHANDNGYFVDLAIPFFDNRIQFRRITNGTDNGWRRIITEEPNHNVLLCDAGTGGNVGIANSNPSQKLDVNGHTLASGFIHRHHQSDDAVLLAGGGYKTLNSIYGGDINHPVFLGYLNLDHGNDGTVSSSFSCLGYSVPFTYTRGGNYCRITIPDTTHQVFYIMAATASVNYSGGGMDTWVGYHRGSGTWWLHCYASSANEVKVKGFRQSDDHNDSWWGGNPLWSNNDGANKITVCIFGYVKFR